MKRALAHLAAAAVILAASSPACSRKSASGGSSGPTDGYHVVCKHCSHHSVIPQDQLESYPSSPQGEGYRCEKCGKFGSLAGKQCPQCKKWYLATYRGMPCPYCSKAKPT